MQLIEYLLCVATRHELAKDEHEEELKERSYILKKRTPGRRSFKMTYEDEAALLKGVIASIRGKPSYLKKVSLPAIGVLAYIVKAKMANNLFTETYDIIFNLVVDPEKTIVYLNALAELKDLGWVRLVESQGMGFTDLPPFSWLQWHVELGKTFHKEMGVTPNSCNSFTSNDDYLDAVFAYLYVMIQEQSSYRQVTEPETDLAMFQPEGWHRRIFLRVQASTCKLQAFDAQEKHGLTIFQYLALIGLLGTRDGDLDYDFSTPSEVARLFARGRVCRKLMQDHLFGEKSPLLRQRLLEGTRGMFGESVRLTQLGITALIGRQSGKTTAQELKNRVKKHTLFDLEIPKVKKEALLLPPQVTEAVRALLFSETQQGQRIRKNWHTSLPAAWGSPTGSTVLLYGPSGTGKTLTAQYLASELKLPLLKIDAARVLSCWVGESEQNVRRIFDDYATLHKELGKAPVLLLNEADQLLGARDTSGTAVDRMNNNMQNLFLEGLERFAGVLVATTNRRDLLDDAFSRRFTYKLELPPPDRMLRVELWKSHLPLTRLVDDVDIEKLADLGLTGGEIRLVIERAVRLMAYRGLTVIDHKTLTDIAREELTSRMKQHGSTRRVGF